MSSKGQAKRIGGVGTLGSERKWIAAIVAPVLAGLMLAGCGGKPQCDEHANPGYAGTPLDCKAQHDKNK